MSNLSVPRYGRLLTALAVAGSLHAQVQFQALRMQHLPQHLTPPVAVLEGDLDGDGVAELIAIGQISAVYRRAGPDRFVEAPGVLPRTGSFRHAAAALADLDGDGDLDLVIARRFSNNHVYLNDGTGTLQDASLLALPFVVDDSHAVAAADVDGDGDVDLIFGNLDGDRLYRNAGAGRFTLDPTALVAGPGTSALAAFDVDGDGDVDLVRAGPGPMSASIEINDGRGRFRAGFGLPPDSGGTVAMAAGDVDADGDTDLVLAKQGQPSRVWLNDGSGGFGDVSTRLPASLVDPFDVALADLDGDRDLEMAWATARGTILLRNDVSAYTDVSARLPRTAGHAQSVAFLDFDSNGALDLLVGQSELSVYLNVRNMTWFVDATGVRVARIVAPNALADVDGDGDLDLIAGPATVSGEEKLYINDGHGAFADETEARWTRPAAPLGVSSNGLAVGDVDGDGAPDLVLAQPRGQSLLFLNDGAGRYRDRTASHMPAAVASTTAAALGDVDGDGDLDLALGNSGSQNWLYRNTAGRYTDVTAASLPTQDLRTNGIAFADVDGDGDLDLLTADMNTQIGSQVHLYRNDGTGRFADVTAGNVPPTPGYDGTFAIADANGDGALDLVVNGAMLFNDGSGRFSNVTPLLPAPPGILPLFTDIDEDGWLDLLTYGQAYRGDGRGRFFDASARFGGNVPAPYAAGDLDGDGDNDLIASYAVYTNQHQQMAVPRVPRVGGRLELDVYATPRYGTRSKLAVAWLFAQPTRPLSLGALGTLHFDPAVALFLGTPSLPVSTGQATISLPVPALASLTGQDVYAQSLVLHPQRLRLTNRVRATLVR